MGIKIKTTAVLASIFIVSNTVSVQANTAVSLQKASALCAGGFAGCVLPGKTAPAKTPVVKAPGAAAAAAEGAAEAAADKPRFPVVAIIAALGAAAGAILIASGGDDDAPTSP